MIDLGDVLPDFAVEIKDASGVLADPGALALTLTLPDGTALVSPTTIAYTHPSTGKYQVTYVSSQAGRHVARWVATGANASAFTQQWDVRPAAAAGIISVADAAEALRLTAPSTADQERLRSLIDAATDLVERGTRNFRGCGAVVRRTVTSDPTPPSSGRLFLSVTPVISVISVTPYGQPALSPSSYTFSPGGIVSVTPYGYWSAPSYVVVYEVGRVVIPSSIIEGTIEIVRHLWESRYRGPASMPLADEEVGAGATGAFALPYKAADFLQSWQQGPAVA